MKEHYLVNATVDCLSSDADHTALPAPRFPKDAIQIRAVKILAPTDLRT